MADKASKFDPKEIADVAQNTLRKFTSLDTPQDMTAAETAADIAAGFVPGIGTAQSARDFERARREGDKLGMGLSAVGMVPVVGGVVKPAKVAARSLGDLVDQYVRRVRKMEELGPAGYSVHKVEAPASSEVPGWHISQDLPGILSTGAMTNKAVGANNIQGWVPAHVGGAYFYSDPRLARAKWEDLADVVGDPKLAAEMPVIRAQLRRGNRLVPDEDVSLSVPWQQSYQEGSFATKRPVLINQIDRIYSADPSVTKDMIRDTIIRQRRYAAGGAVDFEKGGKAEFDPKEIASVAEQTLKKFTSLDTPQNMSSAETVADIAAGFVPGIGTAQSARDFERARREGDKLGMGLSAVGMIPVVGGVVKPARKAARSLVEMAEQYGTRVVPQEQKMLQGFYRGYAGDYDAARAAAQDSGVFVSPQRAVGEYYGAKRAAQTGAEPHLEMILADPFAGRGYGHSTLGTGKNPPMITRARELAPEDVKSRTKLYAEGGAVADTNPNALVTQAYRDILQRDPEQEGLQYWTNQLSTNQLTPESLYQNIAASAQSADAPNAQRYANALQNRNLVTQAYRDILQRAPEQEGLSYWTGQLNTGALTPETLRQNILASAQGADASKAQQYAQNFAATQPQPTEAIDPDSYRNPYGPRRTLDDLASMYSIGMYFIPGMQLAAPIDFALRALSLANTAKKIGKIFRFAEGGPVNYDPTEIDTIVSRVKEELHG